MKNSKPETITLRIIAGALRSRRIQFTCDPRTRPMKDRTREAVMNLLGGTFENRLAFDFFGGSGAMAFEAISRGAQHAYVWEILRPGANTIRKFAEELGISDQVTILAEDTFRWSKPLENGVVELLKRTGNPNGIAAPWLVFCCPPYSLWESQGGQLKDLLSDWASLAPKQSLFAVELEQKTEEHYLPESLSWDIRTYSPAKIAVAEV